MPRVTGRTSQTVFSPTASDLIGAGSEGLVYRAGQLCVKVMKDKLTDDEIRRVEFLSRRPEGGYAWPLEVANNATGEPIAIVFPFVHGKTYEAVMDARETACSTQQKIALAASVVAAVQAVHTARSPQIVLNDLIKASNLVVDGHTATFIDTASVNVSALRAPNGTVAPSISRLTTPGYTAPEILDTPRAIPTHASDVFSLAVLLCETLWGRSPTDPLPSPAAVGFDPDLAVKSRIFFPFCTHPELDPPTYDAIDVPERVKNLLQSALMSPPHERPTADHFARALRAWSRSLKTPSWWRGVKLSGGSARIAAISAAAMVAITASASVAMWVATHPSRDQKSPTPQSSDSPPRKPVGPALFQETFK